MAPVSRASSTAGTRVIASTARGVGRHETRASPDAHPGLGAIVNCSSPGGLVGIPGRAAYHVSKHGDIGLTTSAALEYAPCGIRINVVCPGTIEISMIADMITKGELDPAQAAASHEREGRQVGMASWAEQAGHVR